MSDVMYNVDDVMVQQETIVYTAPVGTQMPADVTVKIAAPWKSVGYLNPDGLELKASTETEEISALQALNPVKTIVKKQSTTVTLGLMELTGANFKLVFGGKVEGSGGKYIWKPDPTAKREHAFIIEVKEGTKVVRYLIESATPAGDVSMKINQTGAIELPVELKLNTPFTIQTNAESFKP